MGLELIRQPLSEYQLCRNEFGAQETANLRIRNMHRVHTERQLIPVLNPVHDMDLFMYDQFHYYPPSA